MIGSVSLTSVAAVPGDTAQEHGIGVGSCVLRLHVGRFDGSTRHEEAIPLWSCSVIAVCNSVRAVLFGNRAARKFPCGNSTRLRIVLPVETESGSSFRKGFGITAKEQCVQPRGMNTVPRLGRSIPNFACEVDRFGRYRGIYYRRLLI